MANPNATSQIAITNLMARDSLDIVCDLLERTKKKKKKRTKSDKLVTAAAAADKSSSNLPKWVTDGDVSFDGEGRDGQYRRVGGRLREQARDDAGHLIERIAKGVPRAVNFEGHSWRRGEKKGRSINSTVERLFCDLDLMYN